MKNTSTYRDLVAAAVAIPSVSTDTIHKDDMKSMARWYEDLFVSKGFSVKSFDGYGNPVVRAEYKQDKDFPTCLVYGHYDVQPSGISDEWGSDPFELTERNGRLYGRGVADNKGQAMIHFTALFEAIEAGVLPYNIIVLLEGDEETGAGDLCGFLTDHKDLFAADFALISDGTIAGSAPLLEIGFRGSVNMTMEVITAHTDAHSGTFGGLMPNAAHVLQEMIGGLYDEKNQLICGKSYVPENIPEDIWKSLQASTATQESLQEVTGAQAFCVSDDVDITTCVSFSPTVQVTGISSGYTGIGYRNSIPAKAKAKINIRTAPGQDPAVFLDMVCAYLLQNAPAYATVLFDYEGGAEKGVLLPFDNPYMDRVRNHLEEAYGTPPLLHSCGGTLPIACHIEEVLQIPQLHVPLANEDCGMHAPNENMTLSVIEKGLAFSRRFFGL